MMEPPKASVTRGSGIGNGRMRMPMHSEDFIRNSVEGVDAGDGPHSDVLASEYVQEFDHGTESSSSLISTTTCQEARGRGTFRQPNGSFREKLRDSDSLVIKRMSFHFQNENGMMDSLALANDSDADFENIEGENGDVMRELSQRSQKGESEKGMQLLHHGSRWMAASKGLRVFRRTWGQMSSLDNLPDMDLAMLYEDTGEVIKNSSQCLQPMISSEKGVSSDMPLIYQDTDMMEISIAGATTERAEVEPNEPLASRAPQPVIEGNACTEEEKSYIRPAQAWLAATVHQTTHVLEELAKRSDAEADTEPDAEAQFESAPTRQYQSTEPDLEALVSKQDLEVVVATTQSLLKTLKREGYLPGIAKLAGTFGHHEHQESQHLPAAASPPLPCQPRSRFTDPVDSHRTNSTDARSRAITPRRPVTPTLPVRASRSRDASRCRGRLVRRGLAMQKSGDGQGLRRASMSLDTELGGQASTVKAAQDGVAIKLAAYISEMLWTSLSAPQQYSGGYVPYPKSQSDADEEASLCYSSCEEQEVP